MPRAVSALAEIGFTFYMRREMVEVGYSLAVELPCETSF